MVKVKGVIAKTFAQATGEKYPAHYYARKGGDPEMLTYLAKQGMNVDAKDGHGLTPLHHASIHGCTETARALVNLGVNINRVDRDGWDALHLAAINGHVETARVLIEQGALLDAAEAEPTKPPRVIPYVGGQLPEVGDALPKGITPLIAAARAGHASVCSMLAEQGADLEATDVLRNTALIWATMQDYADVVAALVAGGANVEAEDCKESRPLHIVGKTGNREIADVLLQAGADVNACPITHFTAFNVACRHGHAGVAKLLLDAGYEFTPEHGDLGLALHRASGEARVDIVEMLVAQADASVDVGLSLRYSLLAEIAQGKSEAVAFLIRNGADVSGAGAGASASPIWPALGTKRPDIAEMLIRAGADVNVADRSHHTLLDLVKTGAQRRFLRRHGALFGHEVER